MSKHDSGCYFGPMLVLLTSSKEAFVSTLLPLACTVNRYRYQQRTLQDSVCYSRSISAAAPRFAVAPLYFNWCAFWVHPYAESAAIEVCSAARSAGLPRRWSIAALPLQIRHKCTLALGCGR